ncbi:unnamed protein product [Moneuplotes crassus]|uniref:Uncharacterized protein n=1 Tax=Euplotes crassus TaxID=5936 RepID=A0AAD1XKN9_EUPCR|nr:unnamed protein product [Moneuplotes crassus]
MSGEVIGVSEFLSRTIDTSKHLKSYQKSSLNKRRIRGGVSKEEYEKMFGHHNRRKQPSFMQKNDSFSSIGWGVGKKKLITLPALSDQSKNALKKRKSVEETAAKVYLNSPMKLNDDCLNSQESPQGMDRKPSFNNRDFVKQIDREYSSTGASGFLRMNGSFSNHVDKKLNLQPDLYHSLNMISQKDAIFRKFANSVHNFSYDARDSRSTTLGNTGSENMTGASSKLKRMYNKCERHENWKKFQAKRYPKSNFTNHKNVVSTLPVLKSHKEKILVPKRTSVIRRR